MKRGACWGTSSRSRRSWRAETEQGETPAKTTPSSDARDLNPIPWPCSMNHDHACCAICYQYHAPLALPQGEQRPESTHHYGFRDAERPESTAECTLRSSLHAKLFQSKFYSFY